MNALCILLALLPLCRCAGVGIHTTLISRVHQFFPQDLQRPDLLPYLISGTFFPDAFYTCISPSLSEEIHWPPFLSAAVKFTRETGDVELRAFLYGVFVHQLADSSWHSIRLDQGLLDMIAVMEFDGDVDRAHQFLDVAGDFVVMRKSGLEFYDLDWKYPSFKALKEVLKRLDLDVSEYQLEYCTKRGEVGLRTELKLINSWKVYQKSSPILEDLVESYHLGSLQEITSTVSRCLSTLNDWFEHGPPQNPWLLCPAVKQPHGHTSEAQLMTYTTDAGTILSPYTPLSHFGHAIAFGNFLNEPSVAVSAPSEDQLGSVYILPLSEFSPTSLTRLSGFTPSPGLGTALLTYSVWDMDYLVVSEPGLGMVYIYAGNDLVVSIHGFHSEYGSKGPKQQGTWLHSWDLDGDGWFELFVSCPYDDVDGKPQAGEVFILAGDKLMFLLLAGGGDVEMQDLIYGVLSLDGLDDGYDQFGVAVTGDEYGVYVSSPGSGVVLFYGLDLQLQNVIYKDEVSDTTLLKRRRSSISGMFGSCLVTETYADKDYVMVGAPGDSCVYVYTVGVELAFYTKLVVDDEFGKFGSTIDLGGEYAYISAPGYEDVGAVFKVPLAEVFSGDRLIKVTQFKERGHKHYSGFGKSLGVYNDMLFIGEPEFGYAEMFNDAMKLTGRLGIYTL